MTKSKPKEKRGPARGKGRAALSAQQTVPYVEMLKDGVCRVRDGYYTKTIAYEDINYSVASTEDQAAIFNGWCGCLNYFDSALPFQLSFVNHRSRGGGRYQVNIPPAQDEFDSIRAEYTEMLKRQIARSNNGIVRSKYITFGISAADLAAARPRLERVEADICGNFKRLGVHARALNGWERLEALHGQMHPGGREPFRFAWEDIPKTGMGTKDFIVPDSFDFRQSRTFRVGQSWGAASYLQIMASELSDKLLLELLELDAEMTVTLHVQTVDQTKAIKTVKGKISDIDKMKVEEQRKATRSGYDPDILPPDLITYAKDAAALLADLQSRNERMFLLTFLVVNMAPTRERLENEVFTVSGIAQKHNCALRRLDWQQEQGYLSSLPLGYNGIEIQRGMTTSSTAIFIPFMTKELRMDGPSLYYGMNALSGNIIMADRKRLKNPNGLFLGTPGSGKSFAAKREIVNVFLTWPEDDIVIADPEGEYYPLVHRLGGQVVKLTPSASSGTYINPMDINPDYADDEDPLSLKSDFILSGRCGMCTAFIWQTRPRSGCPFSRICTRSFCASRSRRPGGWRRPWNSIAQDRSTSLTTGRMWRLIPACSATTSNPWGRCSKRSACSSSPIRYGGASRPTGTGTGRPGYTRTSSMCFCPIPRWGPTASRFSAASASGGPSQAALPKMSKACWKAAKSSPFSATAIFSICSPRPPEIGRCWPVT